MALGWQCYGTMDHSLSINSEYFFSFFCFFTPVSNYAARWQVHLLVTCMNNLTRIVTQPRPLDHKSSIRWCHLVRYVSQPTYILPFILSVWLFHTMLYLVQCAGHWTCDQEVAGWTPAARFTGYLTFSAKVTIDLQRTSKLLNISWRTQGFLVYD